MENQLKKLRENVNKRAFIYFLLIPTLLFYTLALTGCVSESPGVSQLFLIQATARASDNAIKIGYFGMCGISGNSANSQVCSSISGASEETLSKRLFPQDNGNSSAELVQLGLTFSTKIFLPVFAAAGVAFAAGTLCFLWFQIRSKKSSGNPVSHQSLKSTFISLLALSCVLCFGAAISITMAVAAIQFLDESQSPKYQIAPGKPLQILQWLAFGFSVIIAIGMAGIAGPSSGSPTTITANLPGPKTVPQPAAAIDF